MRGLLSAYHRTHLENVERMVRGSCGMSPIANRDTLRQEVRCVAIDGNSPVTVTEEDHEAKTETVHH
jgi:hypothetical protein